MTKRRAIIIVSIIVVLVLGAVGLFFRAFEKVEEEVYKPPAGEARTNRYLALERFLNADGWEAYTVKTAEGPNYTDGLIIIAGDVSNYGPEQIDEWKQWAIDGGHLVFTEPDRDVRRRQDMVDAFGFGEPPPSEIAETLDEAKGDKSKKEGDEKEGDEKEGEEKKADEKKADEKGKDAKADDDSKEKVSEPIPMWGDKAEYHKDAMVTQLVADCSYTHLDATNPEIDRVWLGKNDCLLVASKPLGQGRVTVFSDLSMLNNQRLREFQHPTLAHDTLWQATETNSTQARISLYGQRVSWMGYLWGLFWPTITIGLILLALALIAGTKRFGPLVAPIPNARRQRTEHVMAIGRFLWKHDAQDALLRASQEALLHRIARGTLPSNMSREEKAKWLAERTNISTEEALRILAEYAPASQTVFADLIKKIEDLRRR